MRQTPSILYIAVDSLIAARGKGYSGFGEFTAALDHAGIPAVWVTSRSRVQLDEPRRRLGHTHPFIAEDGCAAYLPADYFHLRPKRATPRGTQPSSLRLGRFTCIPCAKLQPAATEAVEALSGETGIAVVTLRLLSAHELSQNTELPEREAELARQRDFSELFFFAGATQKNIDRFLAEGRTRGMIFAQHGALWIAAIGASTSRCVTTLSKLYDRALRYHAPSVAVTTAEFAPNLLSCCDRSILLTDAQESPANKSRPSARVREIQLGSPAVWERVLETAGAKP